MDAAKRFAANLIQHRKRADLTQEELGQRAAINRSQVGKLEMGKTLPRLDTLLRLAGALTVPVGDLTKGIAWKPPQSEGGEFEARSPDSALRSEQPESG